MSEVVSSVNLNRAFELVYQRRIHDHPNSDVWAVSLAWPNMRRNLQNNLLTDQYQLSPLQAFKSRHGRLTRWSTVDAIVLKAISLVLKPIVSKAMGANCYHVEGRGGLKGALRTVRARIAGYRFVVRSDVANYYASMAHNRVLAHCQAIIRDRHILRIIKQYLNRVEVVDGEHSLIEHGIPKGCSLSPLVGAIMLKSLDAKFASKDVCYVRYMDDWIILTKTKSMLRRAVKKMHAVMHALGFKLALDKTYIGRIQKGFDFLGYRFVGEELYLAQKTLQNFKQRIAELYEQGAGLCRIRQYVRRWLIWTRADGTGGIW